MFFVAFNQRQNKLLSMIERAEMVQKANDRQNLLYINDEVHDSPIQNNKLALSQHISDKNGKPKETPFSPKHPMNVILLRKEVDLE
jgi:hypothetical protein